jgi:CBS domain-containing protein
MKDLIVEDVMTQLVVTVGPNDTIKQAAQKLLRNRISGAPVVEDGKLVGLVSEADIAQAFVAPVAINGVVGPVDPLALLIRGSRMGPAAHHHVGDVMSRKVVSIGPEETVWKAAALIDRHNVRRLPVVDEDGYVVGVVARADLVRAMARDDRAIQKDIEHEIRRIGSDRVSDMDVEVDEGVAVLSGAVKERATHFLASMAASQVPGVVEVDNEISWSEKDEREER